MTTASTFKCFGLVIHGYSLKRTLDEVQTRVAQNFKTWIVTANPEILLFAKNNSEYWEILRQADLRLVDGFGLKIAGRFKGAKPERCTGVELATALAASCEKNKWTLALVGGVDGVANKAAWELRRRYPNLIVFAESGGEIDPQGRLDKEAERCLARLHEYEPKVVLVAYGHPKQDYWIYKHSDQLPTAKVFVGVGGTLDFWAGTAKRAPEWIQKLGLEWLYRLIKEPKRWKRIWNAVIRFPIAVLFSEK